ncbi:MAG: fibronectin type III domain-containing protein [Actinobacteria bacterium]|nr:fibronectin type III domain-containing protein [Actinomycetota bacterium]MCB9413887.1 fibronectin type III domain-containing protein [Actinomycetota bacterium]
MKTPHIILAMALIALASTPAVAVLAPEPESTLSMPDRKTTTFTSATSADTSRAVAVWRQFDGAHERIQARSLEIGQWGPTAVLSSSNGDAGSPQVAVSPSGENAVAVWVLEDGNESIVQSRWFSNGTWGVLKQVGTDTEAAVPQVDITSDGGTALVMWREGSGADRTIRVAWGHDGQWDAPDDLTAPGTDSVTPTMDLSDDGTRAIALWRRYAGGYYNVESTEWAGSTWSPPQWLSASVQTTSPDVALVDGGAVATWVEVRDATLRVLSARRAAGQWGEEDVLSAQGSNAYTPVLDTAGSTAAVAWRRDDSGTGVVEAVVDAGTGWGATQTLSRPGESSFDPHVSLSKDGASAMAVWTQAVGQLRKVTGAHYDDGSWDMPVDVSSVSALAGSPTVLVDESANSGVAFWRGHSGTFGVLRTSRVRNIDDAITPPATGRSTPAAVTGLRVKVRKRYARVSWQRGEAANSYRVVVKKRGSKKVRIRTVSAPRTRFAVTKGRYRVKVSGINAVGQGPSDAKRFKVPPKR